MVIMKMADTVYEENEDDGHRLPSAAGSHKTPEL